MIFIKLKNIMHNDLLITMILGTLLSLCSHKSVDNPDNGYTFEFMLS